MQSPHWHRANMLRVLIIDDDLDNAESLTSLVESLGYGAKYVTDGSLAAVAFVEYRPHLVILDVRMPSADGYQLCGQLRGLSMQNPVAIVALTGIQEEEFQRHSLADNFDAVFYKPTEPRVISALLRHHQSKLTPQQTERE